MDLEKLQTRIDRIDTRQKQLEARKQGLEARLKTQAKKHDTRRKILLGALVLETIHNGDPQHRAITEWVKDQLPRFLTRDNDRAIFGDILTRDSGSEQGDIRQSETDNQGQTGGETQQPATEPGSPS